jgi:trimethylamine--corrinoid protein Co-methyltransferase
MAIPRITILSDSEQEAIHNASLNVLEDTGTIVESREALDFLKKAGAEVDYEEWRAKLPRDLAAEVIKRAPKTFTYCARNPKKDLLLEKTKPYFCATGGDPFIIDWETGRRRYCTTEDMARSTVIADYLDHVDMLWPLGGCGDVPEPLTHIYDMVTSLRHSDKHVEGDAVSAAEARYQIEIAAAIVGGREELRARPIISMVNCTLSPLRYDRGMIEASLELAKAGVPVAVMPMPMSGVSAPVTLAGTLVEHNAEFLGGLAIIQLASPGAPVVYAAACGTVDFRTGLEMQSAEMMLLNAGLTQMAHFYELPSESRGMRSASKLVDAQAGYEKAIALIPRLLSGPDIVLGLGGLEGVRINSPVAMVIDNEIIDYALRYVQGIEVSDETLAVEVIHSVGPRGNYLGERHTVEHFRERWKSRIADISAFETWEAEGSKPLEEVAKEKVREILASHKPQPLSEAAEREISYILKKSKEELVKENER